MVWQLQENMKPLVGPSIHEYIKTEVPRDPVQWLAERYADQRWDQEDPATYDQLVRDACRVSIEGLIASITEHAIEQADTTNGGHEVYITGFISIPFISDEKALEYYC